MKNMTTEQHPHKKRGRKKGYRFPPVTLHPEATVVRPAQQHFITGLSKSTVYRLIKAGQFPPQRKLTEFASGWLRSELEDWVKSR
jgi:predicted DNA-binding transcriptional regulator AlpA